MSREKRKDLWTYREAKSIGGTDRFIYYTLFVVGIISILRFADWWFRPEHIQSLPLYIILSLIMWYGIRRP